MKYLNNYIKHVNESLLGNKDIKEKFTEFVYSLSEWQSVNQEIFKISDGLPEYYIDDLTSVHQYSLYENVNYKLDKGSVLELDNSIEYYIKGVYLDLTETDTDYSYYYIYDGNKFTQPSEDALSYLSELTWEDYSSMDNLVHKVDYVNWLTNRKQTLGILKKLNI